jgi:hypothetical protein
MNESCVRLKAVKNVGDVKEETAQKIFYMCLVVKYPYLASMGMVA